MPRPLYATFTHRALWLPTVRFTAHPHLPWDVQGKAGLHNL